MCGIEGLCWGCTAAEEFVNIEFVTVDIDEAEDV